MGLIHEQASGKGTKASHVQASMQLSHNLQKVLTFFLVRCMVSSCRHGTIARPEVEVGYTSGSGGGSDDNGRGIAPTYHPAVPPSRPPASHAHLLSPSQAPSPQYQAGGDLKNGTLDPTQVQALHLLGVATGPNPCTAASRSTLVCDGDAPYQHLVSLRLDYCAEGARLPPSAWLRLSSLNTLAFEECPAQPFAVPTALARSMQSLTIVASFGRSVSDVTAPPLRGTWIASFYNLVELSVSDVEVNSSSLHAIVSNMKHLQQLSFSDTNIKGQLPTKWPSHRLSLLHLSHNDLGGHIPASLARLTELQSLDLSSNNLRGALPEELGALQNLQYLSLASNQLSGGIPNLIQNLRSLVYIDLSNNQFTGSIPSFFTNMPSLRYIDMRGNYLEGMVPFTESFLQGLNSCKLGGNLDLCFNKSVVQSVEFLRGVMPCKGKGSGAPGSATSGPSPSPLSAADGMDPFKNLPVRRHGPNKAIILIALALTCTVGAILMAACLSRHCSPKDP